MQPSRCACIRKFRTANSHTVHCTSSFVVCRGRLEGILQLALNDSLAFAPTGDNSTASPQLDEPTLPLILLIVCETEPEEVDDDVTAELLYCKLPDTQRQVPLPCNKELPALLQDVAKREQPKTTGTS